MRFKLVVTVRWVVCYETERDESKININSYISCGNNEIEWISISTHNFFFPSEKFMYRKIRFEMICFLFDAFSHTRKTLSENTLILIYKISIKNRFFLAFARLPVGSLLRLYSFEFRPWNIISYNTDISSVRVVWNNFRLFNYLSHRAGAGRCRIF